MIEIKSFYRSYGTSATFIKEWQELVEECSLLPFVLKMLKGIQFFFQWERSENVGLSSENMGENPMPRNPKVSSARLVHRGLVRI